MNKQTIEIAALLIKWRRKHEGKQCSHMFCDVVMRGGPRITYETVRTSERQCVGRKEVAVKTSNRWLNVDRNELVWIDKRGYERYEDAFIEARCPECGQSERSEVVVSDTPKARECKNSDYDDIPF